MKKVIVTLICMFLFIVPASASEINHFYAESDDAVALRDTVNASAALAGTKVSADGKVNGVLFGAGNDVTLSGEVDYGVVAGNNVDVTGTVLKDAGLNIYLNNDYYNTLNSESQNLIQTHTWGVGAVTSDNTDLAAQIASENGTTWSGNIGLMSASEYFRSNTNTEQCGNYKLNNSNYSTCKTTNYIVPTSGYLWTISPSASNSNSVFFVLSDGDVGHTDANTSAIGVVPALYLTSNITLEGEGTESNPYTIVS